MTRPGHVPLRSVLTGIDPLRDMYKCCRWVRMQRPVQSLTVAPVWSPTLPSYSLTIRTHQWYNWSLVIITWRPMFIKQSFGYYLLTTFFNRSSTNHRPDNLWLERDSSPASMEESHHGYRGIQLAWNQLCPEWLIHKRINYHQHVYPEQEHWELHRFQTHTRCHIQLSRGNR